MNSYARKYPSLGFIIVCLTYAFTIAFFLWGFSTPDLDRVWTIHHELKIGKMQKLKGNDRRILQASMQRHPNLARALLKGQQIGIISENSLGWISTPTVTILRTSISENNLRLALDVQTPDDLIPFSIGLRIAGFQGIVHTDKLAITEQGTYSFVLPQPGAGPEIIEIKLKDNKFEADPSMLGIRISFPESDPARSAEANAEGS
jgi:hypothetical protein